MNGASPIVTAGVIGLLLAATQASAQTYQAQQISSGAQSNCAVALDSESVDCWGSRPFGVLGDGIEPPLTVDELSQPTPSPVVNLGPVTFLSARSRTACAVETDGAAYCWGDGRYGQRGDGSNGYLYAPVPVSGGHHFKEVVAGKSHSCGLTTDDDLYCWGRNNSGQLGNSSLANSSIPVAVETNLDAGVRTLAVSLSNTCAIDLNDSLFCWGSNAWKVPQGQSGSYQLTPNPIEGFAGVTASVALTQISVCATKNDGTLYCWGAGTHGVLGNGVAGGSVASPRQIFEPADESTQFLEVSAGQFTVCATTTASGAFCWGSNVYGNLGDGSFENRAVPTAIAEPGDSMVVVRPGEAQTCGLLESGDLYCWGRNSSGQLGDPDFEEPESPLPIPVPQPVPEPIAPLGVAAALISLSAMRRAATDGYSPTHGVTPR